MVLPTDSIPTAAGRCHRAGIEPRTYEHADTADPRATTGQLVALVNIGDSLRNLRDDLHDAGTPVTGALGTAITSVDAVVDSLYARWQAGRKRD
jgi:hypothetical protein